MTITSAIPGPATPARERAVDVLIVGAGPAGLTAAAALARAGADVEVVDREAEPGGIPRHSHHTGYGIRDLHRIMTGPRYARALAGRAIAAGAHVRPGVTVTGWAEPLTLETTSPGGIERVHARAVILATGARERPRPARLIPGSRPEGIYTTGHLQQAVYHYRQHIGTRAVIVGAEHVSYSAATTLAHAGVRVACMLTPHPVAQSYLAFRAAAALAYRFPVRTGCVVHRIRGRERVSGLEIRDCSGNISVIACDTVVFTGDWIPDHELARRGGISLDPGTRGPAVDQALRTLTPGVFAIGNLIHPVQTADLAALDGVHAAGHVLGLLSDGPPASTGVPVQAGPPLHWISPNIISAAGTAPPRNRFVVWSGAFIRRPRFTVTQAGRVLHTEGHRRTLIPQRPCEIGASWLRHADIGGGPITISVGSH